MSRHALTHRRICDIVVNMELSYPIAFCDYDGTIFDAQAGRVPLKTLRAIDAYTRAGGVFVVTTGRMYRSILKQLDKMHYNPHYLVCLQGSVGYDFTNGEEVFCHDLPNADWHALARYAEERGWTFQAYHGVDVYSEKKNPYSEEYFAYTEIRGIYAGEHLSTWPKAADWDMHKMIVMSPADETPQRIAALRAAFPHLDITCSTPRYIEVVSRESGKGNGVRAMCDYLGYDPARAVAFGDELNDMTLLQAAGLSVAVGNAVPALKEAANYVCAPCAKGGVGDVLDAIVKGTPLV